MAFFTILSKWIRCLTALGSAARSYGAAEFGLPSPFRSKFTAAISSPTARNDRRSFHPAQKRRCDPRRHPRAIRLERRARRVFRGPDCLRVTLRAFTAQVVACAPAPPTPRPSAVPTCLAKACLSATLDRTKLVSRPVHARRQIPFRSHLVELLR